MRFALLENQNSVWMMWSRLKKKLATFCYVNFQGILPKRQKIIPNRVELISSYALCSHRGISFSSPGLNKLHLSDEEIIYLKTNSHKSNRNYFRKINNESTYKSLKRDSGRHFTHQKAMSLLKLFYRCLFLVLVMKCRIQNLTYIFLQANMRKFLDPTHFK